MNMEARNQADKLEARRVLRALLLREGAAGLPKDALLFGITLNGTFHHVPESWASAAYYRLLANHEITVDRSETVRLVLPSEDTVKGERVLELLPA